MANPQLENGYTSIANEIMDALVATDLSGQEMRITLFVIRKTYGFNKIEDFISLSQMTAALGISKTRASQVVNSLVLRKILTVTENINGLTKKYKLNKDVDDWSTDRPLRKILTVTENINGIDKDEQKQTDDRPLRKTLTVTEKRKRPLRKNATTKDNITKDNIPPYSPPTKKTTTKDMPGEFERLWSVYPKKAGKLAALRAYKAHIKKMPPINILVEIISRQKQTDQWQRGYIPNPATWINQGRWDDDISSMNGGNEHGSSRVYAGQRQNVSTTRQMEIDAETERLAQEYYRLKENSAASNP